MGSGIGACIPPAPARSRGAWGCNGEIRTSCCSPPHHCTGEHGKSNTDGELEGSAQTDLPEGVGAAISLPGTAVQGGATHLNCPQPLLYLQMCVMGGGRRNCPPHPCTGHENGVHWSHPRDYAGAPPQADSTGSAQLHSERWLEPAQRSRMLAPGWLPASSWLEQGFWWGQAPRGPVCAALRPIPAALVPGRAGGQLCGNRRARAGARPCWGWR